MRVETTYRNPNQLSPGQGSICRHFFFVGDEDIGYIDIEDWGDENLTLLSGDFKVKKERRGHGTEIIKWIISNYHDTVIKPVHLTNIGNKFWRQLATLYPDRIDPNDFSTSEYLRRCKERNMIITQTSS